MHSYFSFKETGYPDGIEPSNMKESWRTVVTDYVANLRGLKMRNLKSVKLSNRFWDNGKDNPFWDTTSFKLRWQQKLKPN